MSFVQPGPTNVQVASPSPGGTIAMQVGFSKNPSRFSYLNAIQRVPSERTLGVYAEVDADAVARITSSDEAQNWPDGTKRPEHENIPHEIRPFLTQRDSQTARLGNLTIDQAQIDVLTSHIKGKASLMMLKKMRDFEKLATDPTQVSYADAAGTSAIGGKLSAATVAAPYVQRGFNYAVRQIIQGTNGAVRAGDIQAIMSYESAQELAETAEIKAWLQNNPAAVAAFQHDELFQTFGLPPVMYGVSLVVTNESLVTSEEGASSTVRRNMFQGLGTRSSVDVNTPIVFSVKEGGAKAPLQPVNEPLNAADLNAAVNPVGYSAFIEIYKEDMTVETKVDDWNRVTEIGVTSDWVHKLTSTRSAFMLTDAI
jgi:hypothetical protein